MKSNKIKKGVLLFFLLILFFRWHMPFTFESAPPCLTNKDIAQNWIVHFELRFFSQGQDPVSQEILFFFNAADIQSYQLKDKLI